MVHNVPAKYPAPGTVPYIDATEAFAKRIGFTRKTIYGDMWKFGTGFEGADTGNDSAFSTEALEVHTDGI